MASLGIGDLENQLNRAVQGTNPNPNCPSDLPSQIRCALQGWISDHLIPVLLTVLVFVTLLFTFYGAFLYFTAYGDETRATQAKKTITYAIVGLIISLTAFGIVYFVQNILISKEAAQNPNITVPSSLPPSNSP